MESPINPQNGPAQEEAKTCQIEEVLAYGSSYLETKMDVLKSSAREMIKNFLVEGSFVFFGIMLLLMATAFLMYGIAIEVGHAFGDKLWLGFVITGGSLVLGKLLFAKFVLFQRRREFEKNRAKETAAKMAFLEAGNHLKEEILKDIDVSEWTRKYPFYSTGIAATTGFIAAYGITSPGLKETDSVEKSSEPSTLVTMLVTVIEDIFKEAVIPVVKEHLISISNLSKEKNKEMI